LKPSNQGEEGNKRFLQGALGQRGEQRKPQNLSFAGRGCFGPVSAAAIATNEHQYQEEIKEARSIVDSQ